ncbi:hypothetical protein FA15DRAFT_659624 [Coprinopsis marcescibilis]|uniref:Uncharacterized protein n=1 Tax=Coprinopsis marcescibilis TaxID=230819 RepID=A0A5C3KI08_COPMA|nr:hypothetical protein FA15DRAFT_659624 [Coprinopsis marcescibilis]
MVAVKIRDKHIEGTMVPAQSQKAVAISKDRSRQEKARRSLKRLIRAPNADKPGGPSIPLSPMPHSQTPQVPPHNISQIMPTGSTRAAMECIAAQWDNQLLDTEESDLGDDNSSDGDNSRADAESDFEFDDKTPPGVKDYDINDSTQEMLNQWNEFTIELSKEDKQILRAFALKVDNNLTDNTYERLKHLNTAGRPQKQFTYLPLTHQLQSMFLSPDSIRQMEYRHTYAAQSDTNTVSNIYDGQ